MSFNITVENDIKRLRRGLSTLEHKVTPQATVRTLNRVAESSRTASAKHIAPQMEVRQCDVKRRMKTIKANRKQLWAVIVASGNPIRLIAFKARQTARGVRAKAWNQTKTYKHSFIAPFKAGGKSKKGVFVRLTSKRLPIKQLWGPGVKQLFKQKENDAVMQATVRTRFAKEFAAHLRFYLNRMKR